MPKSDESTRGGKLCSIAEDTLDPIESGHNRRQTVTSPVSWVGAILASAICSVSGLVTVFLSKGFLEFGEFFGSAPFVVGLVFSMLIGFVAGSAIREKYVLIALWSSILVFSIGNIFFCWLPFLVYGDGYILSMFLYTESVPAKWMMGYQLLSFGYHDIWLASFWKQWVLDHLGGVDVYVMLVSTCVVCLGNIVLLLYAGNRFAVRLIVVTPFLIVLGAGYQEYYPFIVIPYIVVICIALMKQLDRRYRWILSVFAGLLPALYIGFIPLAIMVCAYMLMVRRKNIYILLPVAVSSFMLPILLLWPGSFAEFLSDYRGNLSLDNRIPFQRYEIQVAESRSIFFRWDYVLSSEHLADLRYITFYIGLAVVLALFGGAVILLLPRTKSHFSAWMRNPQFYLAAGLCLQQIQYFLFMVPHFGPRYDIDVYFTVPIVFMIMAGLLWEHVLCGREALRRYVSRAIFPLTLGHGAAIVSILLMSGLPNIYRGMDRQIYVPAEGRVIHPDELLYALDGASVVSNDEQELFVYMSFFGAIAANLEYTGSEPEEFLVTQHFAHPLKAVRCEIQINDDPKASWGGISSPARDNSVTFSVVLQPGPNRIAYVSAPTTHKNASAAIHIGSLEIRPQ